MRRRSSLSSRSRNAGDDARELGALAAWARAARWGDSPRRREAAVLDGAKVGGGELALSLSLLALSMAPVTVRSAGGARGRARRRGLEAAEAGLPLRLLLVRLLVLEALALLLGWVLPLPLVLAEAARRAALVEACRWSGGAWGVLVLVPALAVRAGRGLRWRGARAALRLAVVLAGRGGGARSRSDMGGGGVR